MPAPTKYVPSFSFAGYQATNPSRPLPGPRVDTEYFNIATSLGQTIDGLADIRRDDGTLKNGIVTPESLSPGMALGVLPPTAWASGVTYSPPQAVWQGNKLYQCVTQHVSTVWATDLAAGFWNLVVDFDPPIDEAEAAAAAAQASATAAATSEANALASKNAAAGSATAAQNSATAAAGSATAADTSEANAAASAAAAAGSATAADADADRAEAALAAMMPDAPSDGKTYGRRNAAWAEALAASAYTAADVLAKLKTVDGAGSGLDADLLDGLNSDFFAPKNNPALTGVPTAPTPATGDNSTTLATTAYVKANIAPLAPINNPNFTGTPTAPVPAPGTNTAQLATTSFVAASFAPIANPVFTGDPRAPTPATADNDTSIATTAFVQANMVLKVGEAPSDGQYYSRRNAAWAVSPGGLVDAPNDGKMYARQGAAWVLVHDPGDIAFFARNTPPAGWLKANGGAISRTTYAALFAAIGTTFGAGDGVNTFNLPDLRGEFVRGWDDARGVDAGRTFGSAQSDAYLNHTHTADALSGHYHGTFGSTAYSSGLSMANIASSGVTSAQATGTLTRYTDSKSAGTPSINTSTTGGTETRPRNIALLGCIRY